MLRRLIVFTMFLVSPAVSLAGDTLSGRPRNVIIFIADGCGFNHIQAADDWRHGRQGTEPYESFPVKLSVTNATKDGKITDSAAAATAMSTGEKTCRGRLGVDCDGRRLTHLAERAQKAGKSAGVVTTVPFNHATPAGFCIHNKDRNAYGEIGHEMIHSSGLTVIMGCGGDGFVRHEGWKIVRTVSEFKELAATDAPPARVLGFPLAKETLQQKRPGDPFAPSFTIPLDHSVPDLATMTRGALNVLSRDPEGFFLMVEGGAVDWAADENQTGRMIEEMTDFNRAVEAAIVWVEAHGGWDENLLIVTADHETGDLRNVRTKGKGRMPSVEWHSKKHSAADVPFFAKGTGSGMFRAPADNSDIGRLLGRMMDEGEATDEDHK